MSAALPAPRIVCVGGAAVDRTYRLSAPLRPETSNPAAASSSFGGVARNVAEALARRGVAVDLLSRIGADEAGRALLAGLDAAGVGRGGVGIDPDLATADYVAVIEPSGDLALGLAAMAVLDGLTPDSLAAHVDLLAAATWVFADANLPAETLLALARRSLPGSRYRLSVDAVSVAKAARLPARLDGVDLLFLNADEAAALMAGRGAPAASAAPHPAARALLAAGAGAVVLTLGADGALAADAGAIRHVPAAPARVVDVTGAGDALIAAVLAETLWGASLVPAVAAGCSAAARAIATAGATGGEFHG